jgi:hypothetical protein
LQDIGAAIEQIAEYAQLFEVARDRGTVFWIK